MQYSLKFPLREGYFSEDYVITKANFLAHKVVTSGHPWGFKPFPHHLLVVGPKASGKTHLGHLWKKQYGSSFVEYHEIPLNIKGYIIDDIETWPEKSLLHLFNMANEEQKPLLMLAKSLSNFTLLDLKSRILSTRKLDIFLPDEEMIMVLLIRNFSLRSLKVSLKVIQYLAKNLLRDFYSINLFIERLDSYALNSKSNITIPLVRKLLND